MPLPPRTVPRRPLPLPFPVILPQLRASRKHRHPPLFSSPVGIVKDGKNSYNGLTRQKGGTCMKGRSSGILLPIFSLPGAYGHRLIGWGSPAFHRLSRRRPSARVADSSPCSHGERRFPLYVALRLCRETLGFWIWRTLRRWGCLPGRSSPPLAAPIRTTWTTHGSTPPACPFSAGLGPATATERPAPLSWSPNRTGSLTTPSSARSMTISASLWISGRM